MEKWIDRMNARYAELTARVDDERANLSTFRRNEAADLALTPDEKAELRELTVILNLIAA